MIYRIMICLAILSTVDCSVRASKESIGDSVTKVYFDSISKARALRQNLRSQGRVYDDLQNMFFVAKNRVFEFQWRNNRFVRAPRPLNRDLDKFLTDKSAKSPTGKPVTSSKAYLMAPLYNRFKRRIKSFGQMDCSLSIRVVNMYHYVKIGVILIRIELMSSCLRSKFVKFLWANSFDQTTNLLIIFKNQELAIVFDKPKAQKTENKGIAYKYTLMKNMNPFRAIIYRTSNSSKSSINKKQRILLQKSSKNAISKRSQKLPKVVAGPKTSSSQKDRKDRALSESYENPQNDYYSFGKLSNDNPIKLAEMKLPLKSTEDYFPDIPWKSVGEDFEIFAKKPSISWTFGDIKELLNGSSPLLCQTKYISELKDSQMICQL
jgi:hypothetical protein